MPLYKKNDNTPEKPTATLTIYGEPGCYKTSLALTAANCVLIDFDGGLWRAHGVHDANKYIVKDWRELEQDVRDGIFDEFNAIIFDTVNTGLNNHLAVAIMDENPAFKSVGGGLTLAGYGALSNRFKDFVRMFPGKVLIFIAHEKEEMTDGDYTTSKPDITGATYQMVMQASDQMCWIKKENDKVVINSENNSRYKSKNTAKLKKIEIPDAETMTKEGFFQKEVVDKLILAMSLNVKRTIQEDSKAKEYEAIINTITDVESLNAFIKEKLPELDKTPAMKAIVVDMMSKHAAKNNWEKVKGAKAFSVKAV